MEQGYLPSMIQVGAPGNVTMFPGGNPNSSPFECICLFFLILNIFAQVSSMYYRGLSLQRSKLAHMAITLHFLDLFGLVSVTQVYNETLLLKFIVI